jgi:hypothetical protein
MHVPRRNKRKTKGTSKKAGNLRPSPSPPSGRSAIRDKPQRMRTSARYIKPVVSFLLGVLGTLGTIYGIVPIISPPVSGTPSEPIEFGSAQSPEYSFPGPVDIENEGILPIYDIKIKCAVHEAYTTANSTIGGADLYRGYSNQIDIIRADTTRSTTCIDASVYPIGLGDPIEYANMTIIMSYKPAILPWRFAALWTKREEVHTTMIREPDGDIRWLYPDPPTTR